MQYYQIERETLINLIEAWHIAEALHNACVDSKWSGYYDAIDEHMTKHGENTFEDFSVRILAEKEVDSDDTYYRGYSSVCRHWEA